MAGEEAWEETAPEAKRYAETYIIQRYTDSFIIQTFTDSFINAIILGLGRDRASSHSASASCVGLERSASPKQSLTRGLFRAPERPHGPQRRRNLCSGNQQSHR